MSKPETESAFVTRLARQRVAELDQLRRAHGAKTTSATTAAIAIEPDLPAARHVRRVAQTTSSQVEAEPTRLVACQGGQAEQDADAEQPPVGEAAPSRLLEAARHQQAGAESARTANSIVESGRAEWRTSGR